MSKRKRVYEITRRGWYIEETTKEKKGRNKDKVWQKKSDKKRKKKWRMVWIIKRNKRKLTKIIKLYGEKGNIRRRAYAERMKVIEFSYPLTLINVSRVVRLTCRLLIISMLLFCYSIHKDGNQCWQMSYSPVFTERHESLRHKHHVDSISDWSYVNMRPVRLLNLESTIRSFLV